MKFTTEQLNELKNDDGTYSSTSVEKVEALAGKPFAQVISEAQEASPDAPAGHPSTWDIQEKIAFIKKHGKEGYKKALFTRK